MAFSHRESGYRHLRKGRWSESGRIYLVTTTTLGRARYFEDWRLACRASVVIDSIDTWQPHARLLCWVLMPDHWHGLVQLAGTASLAKAVGLVKGRSSRAVGRETGGKSVWAAGFHDRGIRRDDDLREVARYIVANPVRAGLVTRVGHYPYWNSIWL